MCLLANARYLVVFATVALWGPGVTAQPKETSSPSVNGCGSGWNLAFVPNRVRLARCQFEASCNLHDQCYGQCADGGSLKGKEACDYLKCKRGGDLYGSSACDTRPMALNEVAAGGRRLACDQKLGSDIAALNSGKPLCDAFGHLYRWAVQVLGDPNFAGVGSNGRPQSKTEYEAALRAFLEQASEEQLREFARRSADGSLAVDFKKPLQFSPSTGLTNK